MIAIIDYGVGNLASVQNAFRRVGYPSLVTDQPEQILGAEKVVLPGVGAFADGMTTLRKKGLTDVLYEVVEKEIPLLGICLGMQMLFSTSEEEGLHQGLDLIPGRVRRFSLSGAYKVPHMGWNQIRPAVPSRLFGDVPVDSYVYFVHSYAAVTDSKNVAAYCDYGMKVPALVMSGNVYGCQFHPEKSGKTGLGILKTFASL